MQFVLSTHLLECYKLECVSVAFFHNICYHINLIKLLLLKVLTIFYLFFSLFQQHRRCLQCVHWNCASYLTTMSCYNGNQTFDCSLYFPCGFTFGYEITRFLHTTDIYKMNTHKGALQSSVSYTASTNQAQTSPAPCSWVCLYRFLCHLHECLVRRKTIH